MHYEISRAMKSGRPLTTAQRSSSLFDEEPVVLGKRLRARMAPMKVSFEAFWEHRAQLARLEKAGAIVIKQVGGAAPSMISPEAAPVNPPDVIVPPHPPTSDTMPTPPGGVEVPAEKPAEEPKKEEEVKEEEQKEAPAEEEKPAEEKQDDSESKEE